MSASLNRRQLKESQSENFAPKAKLVTKSTSDSRFMDWDMVEGTPQFDTSTREGQPTINLTTTPRKRVAFNLNMKDEAVPTKMQLTNNTSQRLVYRVVASFEKGYLIKPRMGIIEPWKFRMVEIAINENEHVSRVTKSDKMEVLHPTSADQFMAEVTEYPENIHDISEQALGEYWTVAHKFNFEMEKHVLSAILSEELKLKVKLLAMEENHREIVQRNRCIISRLLLGGIIAGLAIYTLYFN